MYIKELTIDNYKIFKGYHEIRFPALNKPAVFVGVNGAGKTTIIEAIIGCLWEYYYKIQGKKASGDERFRRSNVNLDADEFARVNLKWNGNAEHELDTGFEIRKTIDPEYKLHGRKELISYVEFLKGEVGFFKKKVGIPIVVYYPVERTVLNPSLEIKDKKTGNQFSSYNHAFEKSLNFNDFFEWFRKTEDLENEIRLNSDSTFSSPELDSVRKAILIFLEEFSRIRVRRTEETSLVLEKGKKEYNINQLSHGEKALISMIGDLARRLVIANPGTKNALTGRGIVLIDELDLHLHPNWQRTILGKLNKTFPNIQFICTTHSPLVLNHIEKESIFLLENGKCFELKKRFRDFNSYGADVEDILKIVQGTKSIVPDEVKSMLEELHHEIVRDNLIEAKRIIKRLKEEIDPNHPELKRAETQIRYKGLLGK